MKFFLTLGLLFVLQSGRAQTPASSSAGALGTTPSQITAPSADQKAVLDAEKQRFEAQISKDYAVLDRVLADDLVYTHSHGGSDTKQSYLQSIRDGKSKYDAINIEDQKVRVYGNTAIINGMCLVKALSNGETVNTHLKYTDVYVRKGKQWQMVAWQSIKLAQ